MFYYVYLLESVLDESWYIGFTEDLRKRLHDHNNGKGCRTTKIKTGWRLIYYESYRSKADALGRERFLKSGSGRKYLKKQLKVFLDNKSSQKINPY